MLEWSSDIFKTTYISGTQVKKTWWVLLMPLPRRNFLLVTRYILLVTRYILLVNRYILLVTRYIVLVTGYYLLGTLWYLLVTHCWILTALHYIQNVHIILCVSSRKRKYKPYWMLFFGRSILSDMMEI